MCSTSYTGSGAEAGAPLVDHPDVDLVSFTGSAPTGRAINEAAASRLANTCLELGGKNALVVCDDADLDRAVEWVLASAFSNAGQRCASASRIVVFDAVYEAFRARLLAVAASVESQPVISRESMERILEAVGRAREAGATVLVGGERLERPGWHVAPTVVEEPRPTAEISRLELFGPVTVLVPSGRPRRGDRDRERLALRAHCRDPHGEHPPGDASRNACRRVSSS